MCGSITNSVGLERLRQLDCLESVSGYADDFELRLCPDQGAQGLEERLIVVSDHDSDRSHTTHPLSQEVVLSPRPRDDSGQEKPRAD